VGFDGWPPATDVPLSLRTPVAVGRNLELAKSVALRAELVLGCSDAWKRRRRGMFAKVGEINVLAQSAAYHEGDRRARERTHRDDGRAKSDLLATRSNRRTGVPESHIQQASVGIHRGASVRWRWQQRRGERQGAQGWWQRAQRGRRRWPEGCSPWSFATSRPRLDPVGWLVCCPVVSIQRCSHRCMTAGISRQCPARTKPPHQATHSCQRLCKLVASVLRIQPSGSAGTAPHRLGTTKQAAAAFLLYKTI